jgi:acyl-CoA thioester hydrolase
MKPERPNIVRADYLHFTTLATRWMDNDIYGHVNNAHYYSFFDTAVNQYLIGEGGLNIHTGEVIAYCVESQCRYLSPLAFPEPAEVGLRVGQLGNSSVRYELAIFKQGEDEAAAAGYFVHVFVDRETQRPVAIPHAIRTALERLLPPSDRPL